jgi:hypothetical protein
LAIFGPLDDVDELLLDEIHHRHGLTLSRAPPAGRGK